MNKSIKVWTDGNGGKMWQDARGIFHKDIESALLSAIECALGGNGRAASITPGIASIVADAAEELIPLLQEWEALQPSTPTAEKGVTT